MKKLLEKEKKNILIGLISLIGLIIGSIYLKFLPVLIIIIIIDTLIFYFTRNNKKKTSPIEKLKSFLIVAFCGFIFLLVSSLGFFFFIAITAPEFTQEKLYDKEASVIYNKDGEEIAKLGFESRKSITYDKLSETLIDAIIATEDSRFFQHNGVDLPRFLKASISQLLGQGGGGASTLTMQVSKNAFTSATSTGVAGIIRKFTDVYLAIFQIEPKYTKEEILEFYINSNLMGGQIYGVEQASLTYFGKHTNELNLAESAMIAGLFQAPNSYNPYKYPEECEKRRQVVLNLMLRHGYINQEEYEIAKELTVPKLLVTTTTTTSSNKYQAFIDTVIEEVIDRTGDNPSNVPMKIYTTIDTAMQEHIDDIMYSRTFKWKNEVIQAGTVILNVHNGEIVAVGAGHNRTPGDWNYATMNKRHIGSTAKPLYDFGPGIEYNNWSTATVFTDEPYSYSNGNSIRNWDGKFNRYTTVHDALKYSRNIPSLKAFQNIDNNKVKDFVLNLGLSPEIRDNKIYENHSIGGYTGESPLTVAAAYATFSNGGYYNEPHSITKIIYLEGNKEKNITPKRRRVMSEETAYMITTILEDTSSYAVGLSINGVNYCAKTGTTDLPPNTGLPGNAINDKWIASYNDTYAIAVWLGYKDINKDFYLVSSDSPKSLFQAIAKTAYTKRSSWDMPNGVVIREIETGLSEPLLASEYTPSNFKKKAYFKKGFDPTETSERFGQLNNVTNLDYNEHTGKITWTKIDTPRFLNQDYLFNMASSIFINDSYKNNYLNNLISENNKYIGHVVYKIYIKDSNGNLNLIGTTSDDNYNYQVNGNTTIVVKSSYSILTNNMSSGTELNITGSSLVITSELNGSSEIVIDTQTNPDQEYVEPTNPIIVYENGLPVTDLDNIDIDIKVKEFDPSDPSKYNIYNSTIYINTIEPKTYEVIYTVTYGSYTNTHTKTVIIK